MPEYQAKMMVFFELAFQQTQITAADFTDMIPPTGLGVGGQIPLLLQNLRESFARTTLALVAERAADHRRVHHQAADDDAGADGALRVPRHAPRRDDATITDAFKKANPTLTITLEAAAGPIPIADTLDPASPNYMHWYNPNVGKLRLSRTRRATPIRSCCRADAYALHSLLYGAVFNHRLPAANVACPTRGDDRLPDGGERLHDVEAGDAPSAESGRGDHRLLRSADAARGDRARRSATPRPGFFTTPAFVANWPTNTSNQMRVTLNQTLIVATGMAVDGNDTTVPTSTPGLDPDHSAPGSAVLRLPSAARSDARDPVEHLLLLLLSAERSGADGAEGAVRVPGRRQAGERRSTISRRRWRRIRRWRRRGRRSSATGSTRRRARPTIRSFSASSACSSSANLSWNALVRELVTSPIVTNTVETRIDRGSRARWSRWRAAITCARRSTTASASSTCAGSTRSIRSTGRDDRVTRSPAGCRRTATGAARRFRCCRTSRRCSIARGWRTSASRSRRLVIDAPRRTRRGRTSRRWSSAQPDAAIGDFVSTVMALTSSDPRAGARDADPDARTSTTAQGAGRVRVGRAQVDVRGGVPGAVVDRDRDVRRRTMHFTRRQTLMSALFGAGYVGLRALATGLPASFLLNPRRALAATPAPSLRGHRQGAVHHPRHVGQRRSDQRQRAGHLATDRASCTLGTIRRWRRRRCRSAGRRGRRRRRGRRCRRACSIARLLPPHDQHAGASEGARRAQADGRDLSVGDAAVAAGQAARAVPRHGAGAADHHRRDVAVGGAGLPAGRRCRSSRRWRSRRRWRDRRGR